MLRTNKPVYRNCPETVFSVGKLDASQYIIMNFLLKSLRYFVFPRILTFVREKDFLFNIRKWLPVEIDLQFFKVIPLFLVIIGFNSREGI